jgi:hypothetical protein
MGIVLLEWWLHVWLLLRREQLQNELIAVQRWPASECILYGCCVADVVAVDSRPVAANSAHPLKQVASETLSILRGRGYSSQHEALCSSKPSVQVCRSIDFFGPAVA